MRALEIEIKNLKALLVEAADEFGYAAPETVSVSQKLDEKLNEYRKLRKELGYVC